MQRNITITCCGYTPGLFCTVHSLCLQYHFSTWCFEEWSVVLAAECMYTVHKMSISLGISLHIYQECHVYTTYSLCQKVSCFSTTTTWYICTSIQVCECMYMCSCVYVFMCVCCVVSHRTELVACCWDHCVGVCSKEHGCCVHVCVCVCVCVWVPAYACYMRVSGCISQILSQSS